jgi:hypothetical protein
MKKLWFYFIVSVLILFCLNSFGQIDGKVRVKKETLIKRIPQSGRVFIFYLAANNGSFTINQDGSYYYDADTRAYLIKQIKNKGYEPVIVKLCENDPVEKVDGQLPMPSACSIESMGYNGNRDIFLVIYEEDYSTFRTYMVEKERVVGNVINQYGRTLYSYTEPYKEERVKEKKYVNFRSAIFYFNEAANVNELIYDFSFWGPSNSENILLKKVLANFPQREQNSSPEDKLLDDGDLFSEYVGEKIGYRSRKSGQFIIEPKYDFAENSFSEGLAAVAKGGRLEDIHTGGPMYIKGSKWGYINKMDKEVIPFQYEKALNFTQGLGAVKKNNKWGFININGEEMISFRFDEVAAFREGRSRVKVEDKYGFIDTNGKMIIPAQFDDAEDFNMKMAWVRQNDKEGFIDLEGSFLIPLKYEEIKNRDLNYYKSSPAKANGKWGIIDQSGKEIIPFQFDELTYFSNGFSKIKKNGKWGVINESSGDIFLECVYDDINALSKGEFEKETDVTLVQVKKKGKWGLVSTATLKWLINPQYEELAGRREGMIGYKTENKWGIMNKEGNIIIPAKYDNIQDFYDGITVLVKNNKYGYADNSGILITGLIYDGSWGNHFVNGFAFVCQGIGCGYIDKSGKEVTALKYTWGDSWNPNEFSKDGFAAVKYKGKWGYINTKGETVIKHQFDQAFPFTNGIAAVNIGGEMKSTGGITLKLVGGKWGYINKEGKEVLKIKYQDVGRYFTDGMGQVKINGKWGFVNEEGDFVIKPKYDDVPYFSYSSFSVGMIAVRLNGKWGFIDKKGNTVIDFIYDDAFNFKDGKAEVILKGESFFIDKTGKKISK